MDPKNFDRIQDYINKANEYRALIKDCGNPMKDDKLIHHILKRLPSEYASFVLSYNTHRLIMGSAYQKPTFAEMLIVEQSHLIDLGLLMTSKTKALVTSDEHQSSQGGKSSSNNKKMQWKQKSQSETQQSSS